MPGRRRAIATEQLSLLDLPDAPAPPPRRTTPARRREPTPDADLSALLSELDSLGAALMDDADPVVVELHGAAFLHIGPSGADEDETVVAAILAALADHPTPGGLALALAVQATAEGSTRQVAAEAGDRLVASGVPLPAWAGALAAPLTPGEFWRMTSPAGEASALVGTFHRAAASHVIAVTVDEDTCGEASMIGVVAPDDLHELERAMPPGSVKEVLDPAEFRWQVESALRIRQEHDAEDDEPDPMDEEAVEYGAGSALLRTRLAVLPALDRPLRAHPEPSPAVDLDELFGRSGAEAPVKAARTGSTAGKGTPTAKRKPSKSQKPRSIR